MRETCTDLIRSYSRMWAESENFSKNFNEEIRILSNLPNLKQLCIIVHTQESLFRGWCGDIDYDYICSNMDSIERVIRAHRQDIIVKFWLI